ncbi:GNAT family N-acetyltransferase [Streptomyces sp. NPDC057638]|uniref:GNAT family N-acetyltransferase n=1 Tax=Streptomyces sp. NPDC057638 TaxID=3346190 RepID=UPI0036953597
MEGGRAGGPVRDPAAGRREPGLTLGPRDDGRILGPGPDGPGSDGPGPGERIEASGPGERLAASGLDGRAIPHRHRRPATPRADGRAPGLPRHQPGWTVGVCRDPRAFALLREEWDGLRSRCSSATPFQSHSWLDSWWLSYGGRAGLRIVLVRRQGRLMAAAPLMRVHRPLPLLVWLGGTISDYGDVLADDEYRGPAVAALALGIRRAARGAVVDLREVRPGAAAELLYEAWHGPRRRRADSVCLELPASPMEELVKRLPASRAQRVRAKLRKIDALRIEGRPVTADQVPGAVDRLLRLHALQWRGRGVTVEHLRPRFAQHLVRATRRMVRDGDAALTEYRLDGEVVAASIALFSTGLTGGYLFGAHPGLRERKVDVTAILLRHEADLAAGTGGRVLSLLRGQEPYKDHWRPRRVTNQRLLLAPAHLGAALRFHAAWAGWRERAARAVATRLPAARAWRDRLKDWRAAARPESGRAALSAPRTDS